MKRRRKNGRSTGVADTLVARAQHARGSRNMASLEEVRQLLMSADRATKNARDAKDSLSALGHLLKAHGYLSTAEYISPPSYKTVIEPRVMALAPVFHAITTCMREGTKS